jgi:hypothetical protein
METTLQFDPQSKQLSFRLDQKVTADPEIELKGRAFLNTTNGDFTYSGTLKKYVTTGTVFKGQGTQPLRLGAGIALSSSTQEPTIVASAQKNIGLFDGKNSTVISAIADLEVEPTTKKVRPGRAGLPSPSAFQTRDHCWLARLLDGLLEYTLDGLLADHESRWCEARAAGAGVKLGQQELVCMRVLAAHR